MKSVLIVSLLLAGLIGLLLINTSTGRAQTVPTPNATVYALQTQVAGWQNEVPSLQATQQAAQREAQDKARSAEDQASALQSVQEKLKQANDAINASLGAQALDLANQAAQQVQPLINSATPFAQKMQAGLDALSTAESAYTQALPHLQATAQSYPATVQAAVQSDVNRLSDNVDSLQDTSDNQQHELTTWRVCVLALSIVLIVVSVVSWRQHRCVGTHVPTANTSCDAAARPLTDSERLPQEGLMFVDDPDLVDHFDEVHRESTEFADQS